MDDKPLHDLLEGTLAGEPPIGPLGQNSLAAGIRLRRRRRIRAAATTTAAAAVIAVAIPAGLGAFGQPPRPEQPPAAPTLYVYGYNYTGSRGGTVTPVNTATGTPGTPIHVAGGPRSGVGQIAITPDGKTAYVTGPGTVTPINTASNTPGKPIPIGPVDSNNSPVPSVNVVVTPDGKTVYAITPDGKVTPIDTATNKPGTPIPPGSAGLFAGNFVISPDGKTAYAITMSGCEAMCPRPTVIVTPINTATDTPGTPLKFHTTGGTFGQIAITPDGKTAYVTTGSTVTPINTATDTPGTPIHLASRASSFGFWGQIVITPDGKTAYVLTGSGVTPINTATNTPGTPIHAYGAPVGVIAITP